MAIQNDGLAREMEMSQLLCTFYFIGLFTVALSE